MKRLKLEPVVSYRRSSGVSVFLPANNESRSHRFLGWKPRKTKTCLLAVFFSFSETED